jgi:glycosyltransferase involved in cell wall biosynthesis
MALVCPYDWPEPFGLVLIEALACGTPVLAYRRGSIPEIIEDGTTGFVCEGVDELTTAIHRIPEIDRRQCRQTFEERFSVERMAQDYLRVYRHTLGSTYEREAEAGSFSPLPALSIGV